MLTSGDVFTVHNYKVYRFDRLSGHRKVTSVLIRHTISHSRIVCHGFRSIEATAVGVDVHEISPFDLWFIYALANREFVVGDSSDNNPVLCEIGGSF